ncbi:hypothetical protein B0T14DRAFT_565661 [Immersiella caudata]|uniref:Uncharacterized protein n=1 Tax=Immersiella caudata TaxID=314043 RepID=A0AA39WZB8_9PEZI|nr:hypothetical protein B0T14DRAFT_565661 [Immersiella caudata]
MRQIYEQCSRVLVYLGSGIGLQAHGRAPSRRRLHEIEGPSAFPRPPPHDGSLILQELLTPKYFSRVWASTGAPWVRFVAQQAIPATNVYEALRLTAESQVSDPRDKLFALMGLLREDDRLHPDYGLCIQHFFVGLVSYLITKQGLFQILTHAAGL